MSKTDFLHKSSLYRMKFISRERTIFDEAPISDNLKAFEKAMDNDLHKVEQFDFRHPKNKAKKYGRRNIWCPSNGITLMAVGEFKDQMDYAYVFIVLHSRRYKTPYVVIERYSLSFRNPDTLAEIVAAAFNWVLKGSGVKVVLEPWDTKGEVIQYLRDSWESYNIQLFNSKGRNLVRKGYEDALEASMKEMEPKPKKKYKSDRVEDYIVKGDPALILELLHKAIKNKISPNEIARPVRYLCDEGFFLDGDDRRLPYNAFIAEFPEVKGMISRSSYNDYVDPNKKGYTRGAKTKELEKLFNPIL